MRREEVEEQEEDRHVRRCSPDVSLHARPRRLCFYLEQILQLMTLTSRMGRRSTFRLFGELALGAMRTRARTKRGSVVEYGPGGLLPGRRRRSTAAQTLGQAAAVSRRGGTKRS